MAVAPDDRSFDYREIDDVIHGRVRLAVMAFLSSVAEADFSVLRKKAGVTDGNLSVHLRKLEEAGYVRVEKSFVDRKPLTTCSLTGAGREAWLRYIDRMQQLLRPEAAE